jgi:hypothetical protein
MFGRRKTAPVIPVVERTPIDRREDLVERNAQIIRADITLKGDELALVIEFRPADFYEAGQAHFQFSLVPADPCSASWNPKWGRRLDAVLERLLPFFGVDSLSKLNGRLVRVAVTLGDRPEVWAIGHFLEDRWFTRDASDYYAAASPHDGNIYGALKEDGGKYGPVCLGKVHDRGLPSLLTDRYGRLCSRMDGYTPGYFNARLKLATWLPGKGDSTSVLLKFSECTGGAKPFSVRFEIREMKQLNDLMAKLQAVGGVNKFDRLNGRFVRLSYPSCPDVSTSGIEAELARHFYIWHPVQLHRVDIADFGGVMENEGAEEEAAA